MTAKNTTPKKRANMTAIVRQAVQEFLIKRKPTETKTND